MRLYDSGDDFSIDCRFCRPIEVLYSEVSCVKRARGQYEQPQNGRLKGDVVLGASKVEKRRVNFVDSIWFSG